MKWSPMPIQKSFHLVTLTAGSDEYNSVEIAFDKTMIKGINYTQIVSIQRLQNPTLYRQYAVKKREMEKHNPKGYKNEQWLWYGATYDTHYKINSQGFNRSSDEKPDGMHDLNYSDLLFTCCRFIR